MKQAEFYQRADRGPSDVNLVVIHVAQCGEVATAAEGLENYGARPRDKNGNPVKASWHYAIDNDSTTQSVLEKDVAWHAGPVNGWSIGIEHAGDARQTAEQWRDAYSTAVLERSAKLVADICQRYSIPIRKLTPEQVRAREAGICGHVDVTKGFKSGTHFDPGPAFPWPEYLNLVRAAAGLPEESNVVTLPEQTIRGSAEWVRVDLDGVAWEVSPRYIAPVGIGEAATLARDFGCELPTIALVNRIWEVADLKVSPIAMSPNKGADAAQILEHRAKIAAQLEGKTYELLAGTHKDVVQDAGRIGLYGWHRPDGRVIQQPYFAHGAFYKDYSQGLRLARRLA